MLYFCNVLIIVWCCRNKPPFWEKTLFIRTILSEHRGSNFKLEILPKTTMDSKFECRNFPNESLGQGKHFKHVFWVGVGWEFEKMWIKIRTSEPLPTFTGSYKKRVQSLIAIYQKRWLNNLKRQQLFWPKVGAGGGGNKCPHKIRINLDFFCYIFLTLHAFFKRK